MMPVKLHYNFKDVFRAARFGLSIKKIWIMFLGILIGSIFYSIFTYIAGVLSGYTFKELWDQYHLLPILGFGEIYSWAKIIYIIGILIFAFFIFIFGTAVSKVHFEQLKGDEFYEIKEALKFAFTKGLASFFAPISILLIVGLILLSGVIYGAINKIPYFGEIFFIIFVIPAFFVCLFIVYLLVSFLVSLFISPSIVGTTSNDTFDTLFEIFSTLNEQPWRLFVYEILLFFTMFVAGSIFTFFVGKAIGIGIWVLSAKWLMGEKFLNILNNAWAFLPSYPFLANISSYFKFLGIEEIVMIPSFLKLSGFHAAISYILGFIGYLLIFMVLAYYLSMFYSGNNLIFIILYKKKDEIDLLAPEEEEEIEEEKKEEEKVAEEEKKE
ncbi:MAG: hypothetical protein ABIM77_06300 [candidate division WOR-3 bacterium]